jgi:hypothetical protein
MGAFRFLVVMSKTSSLGVGSAFQCAYRVADDKTSLLASQTIIHKPRRVHQRSAAVSALTGHGAVLISDDMLHPVGFSGI